jgi:hypothetical protein
VGSIPIIRPKLKRRPFGLLFNWQYPIILSNSEIYKRKKGRFRTGPFR